MSNDYLAVFLYRWDDETPHNDGGSRVGFGEVRQVAQHYPSTIIGAATRPVGEPIQHHDSPPEWEDKTEREFREHVHEVADDVRWFAETLECDPDT